MLQYIQIGSGLDGIAYKNRPRWQPECVQPQCQRFRAQAQWQQC